jgi:hypothetical protein
MKRRLGPRALSLLVVAVMLALFGHVCAIPHVADAGPVRGDHHDPVPSGSAPEYEASCDAALAGPSAPTIVPQRAGMIPPTLELLSPILAVARLSSTLPLPDGRSKAPPLFLLHASFRI